MSNNNNTEEVSHELGSERARRYMERQRAAASFLSGNSGDGDSQSPVDDDDMGINAFNSNDMNAAAGLPAVTAIEEPVANEVPKPAVQPVSGDSIIRIKDMKAPVSLSCSFTGKQGRQKKFSIRLNAISVDVSDNGISLMLNDSVTVEPPITEQMKLTYKGKPYGVVFTGGIHRFGPFVNMYFTRILNDVEEEPGTEEDKS